MALAEARVQLLEERHLLGADLKAMAGCSLCLIATTKSNDMRIPEFGSMYQAGLYASCYRPYRPVEFISAEAVKIWARKVLEA